MRSKPDDEQPEVVVEEDKPETKPAKDAKPDKKATKKDAKPDKKAAKEEKKESDDVFDFEEDDDDLF